MQVVHITTEAEYVALSALQDAILLILIAREIKEKFYIDSYCDAADVYCHSFEDNSGTLVIAKLQKMRPSTKHINIC